MSVTAPARDESRAAALAVQAPPPAIALRELVMKWSLILLWLLNLEDFVITVGALRSGFRESNVVMEFFLGYGLLPAAAFKIGVVTVGVLLLWRWRAHEAAFLAALALAATYGLVLVYHMANVVPH
jgi:hypothetical protein